MKCFKDFKLKICFFIERSVIPIEVTDRSFLYNDRSCQKNLKT